MKTFIRIFIYEQDEDNKEHVLAEGWTQIRQIKDERELLELLAKVTKAAI